ncbi:hypothetical protein GTO89_02865 [Heliobacterium gestii]|uniref:Uncharacterized protein n=1 Tax=Heliomicrobium gestii TaxID=2699 RepID=A0A845LBT1_HELGE|nr:hypothetical protein [Heliomicrobium gestii]MBM7865728.1 hypothetical protein [Heliomicrobium gestii]MZP41975.1 hypothetical protein [Heliomicrobium gestii]
MEGLLWRLADLVNNSHDWILAESARSGLTDKELHFWVIGLLGLALFFLIQTAVRFLSRWGLSAVSFVTSFAVVLATTVAIEVEQKIMGRGRMELMDVVAGVAGFLLFSLIYFLALALWRWLRRLWKGGRDAKRSRS